MYRGNLLSARVRPGWVDGSNGFCVVIAWRFCGWAILLLGLLSIYIQQPPFFSLSLSLPLFAESSWECPVSSVQYRTAAPVYDRPTTSSLLRLLLLRCCCRHSLTQLPRPLALLGSFKNFSTGWEDNNVVGKRRAGPAASLPGISFRLPSSGSHSII